VEWASDNRHVLLQHTYQKLGQNATEYILLDREDPSQSLNLNKTLGINPAKLTLHDRHYDQYYVFDQQAATLATASVRQPSPEVVLNHVLDYKTYGSDVILFATSESRTNGKVSVKMRQGKDVYGIREMAPSATYLLDINRYDGDWYAAVGTQNENKVYVYKNPTNGNDGNSKYLVPLRTMRVNSPSYAAFSPNTQYLMVEGSNSFATYDFLAQRSYSYQFNGPIDSPQIHATWLDGSHLMLVSNGKLVMFDYDGINQQTLQASMPTTLPVFNKDYKVSYSFVAQQNSATADKPTNTTYVLTSTPLLTPEEQ
jgi:hypothetical protein